MARAASPASSVVDIDDQRSFAEVGRERVKGERAPVTFFTPASLPAHRAETFAEKMRLWQLALASRRLHHWGETQTRLQGLLTTFADTPFAALYRQLGERTDHYRAAPQPAGSDGAHTSDSK